MLIVNNHTGHIPVTIIIRKGHERIDKYFKIQFFLNFSYHWPRASLCEQGYLSSLPTTRNTLLFVVMYFGTRT